VSSIRYPAVSAVMTVDIPTPSAAIFPAGATIGHPGSTQFYLRFTYGDASIVDDPAATWSSSVPAVATITSNGLASGLTVGTTNIGASKTVGGHLFNAPSVVLTVN
jgi:hypothetical protein